MTFGKDYFKGDPATRAAGAFRTICDQTRYLEIMSRYETRYDRQYNRILDRLLKLRNNNDLPNEPNLTNSAAGPVGSQRGSLGERQTVGDGEGYSVRRAHFYWLDTGVLVRLGFQAIK